MLYETRLDECGDSVVYTVFDEKIEKETGMSLTVRGEMWDAEKSAHYLGVPVGDLRNLVTPDFCFVSAEREEPYYLRGAIEERAKAARAR